MMNPQNLQSSMTLGLFPHFYTSHSLSGAVATLVKGPSEVAMMTERRTHPSRTNPCTHSCLALSLAYLKLEHPKLN